MTFTTKNIRLKYSRLRLTFIFISLVALFSCKKYLDEKPVKNLVTPSTLDDLQALLDAHATMNEYSSELSESISDNYYLTSTSWQASNVFERANYIWDPTATHINSWRTPYQKTVYTANVVLDQLGKIDHTAAEQAAYNNVKGSALFFRAFTFLKLADLYCKPFSQAAQSDLGIVVRLTASIESKSVRSTVQQTYDQIISDLKTAAELLPDTAIFVTRPSKAAAYGLLARTYLSMRDYTNAGNYANLYLQMKNSLMDFNALSPNIPRFNVETIFYNHSQAISPIVYAFSGGKVDSVLYQSYDANDLRKSVFFQKNADGSYAFIGSYDRSIYPGIVFDGVLTDEIYLIRAECSARAGNKDVAMTDLNALLIKRWKTNTFAPLTARDGTDALNKILVERRKELIYRGLRWSDVRRLNLEGANITLKRVINGTTFTLPPNDPRSVLLIPQEIIASTGIQQNPR